MNELCTLSATELASLISAGDVSSREVVEAHLARVDEVNGRVNAVTLVLRESALAAADAADEGLLRGPLRGVPFTVKENIDCMGSPTTHGVPALRRSMPSADAAVVARMKAAGAIVLGRTNLPEYALRFCTDNPLYGPTLNPWDPRLTPGGSSGGDAAALATGMTPFGLGNDLGGSLRNPAYCCGVAALKPTAGRIPRTASIPPLDLGYAFQSMAVEGPMARSVADLRLGLAILAGRDIRDPRSVDAPLRGPAPPVRRAALMLATSGPRIEAATLDAIQGAGQVLAEAGWEVREAAPPGLDAVAGTWLDLLTLDLSALLPEIQRWLSPPVLEYVRRLCAMGEEREASYSELHARRSGLTRRWSEFFAEYPIVIGPIWPSPPWPADADLEDGGPRLCLETARFVAPANVLGLPSVALPTGIARGLPTGIQICADLWREDLCLEAAALIEAKVQRPTPIDPIAPDGPLQARHPLR